MHLVVHDLSKVRKEFELLGFGNHLVRLDRRV